MIEKYEYLVETRAEDYDNKSLQDWLDGLGEEGWRLTTVMRTPDKGKPKWYRYFFERRLGNT